MDCIQGKYLEHLLYSELLEYLQSSSRGQKKKTTVLFVFLCFFLIPNVESDCLYTQVFFWDSCLPPQHFCRAAQEPW